MLVLPPVGFVVAVVTVVSLLVVVVVDRVVVDGNTGPNMQLLLEVGLKSVDLVGVLREGESGR